jgi:hypothetical protein
MTRFSCSSSNLTATVYLSQIKMISREETNISCGYNILKTVNEASVSSYFVFLLLKKQKLK